MDRESVRSPLSVPMASMLSSVSASVEAEDRQNSLKDEESVRLSGTLAQALSLRGVTDAGGEVRGAHSLAGGRFALGADEHPGSAPPSLSLGPPRKRPRVPSGHGGAAKAAGEERPVRPRDVIAATRGSSRGSSPSTPTRPCSACAGTSATCASRGSPQRRPRRRSTPPGAPRRGARGSTSRSA
ncbi:unnamed protein product [Prorocentrum cordatum]|uniref:Uncharacterized protein n=1 Tax=Prorocentrum cordatum TaxID=2364126 RepID=A0ABN9VII1_9DINO|nr:unnamed protein product [Polarella glacialis]